MVEVVPQLDQLRRHRRRPPLARWPCRRGTAGRRSRTRLRWSPARARGARRRRASDRTRVGDERVPVAVAQVDRAARCSCAANSLVSASSSARFCALIGDTPPKLLVVVGHLGQPLVRDAAAARDVAQERQHVLRGLGSAEGQQQEPVVRGHGASLANANAHRVAGPCEIAKRFRGVPTRPWRGSRRRRGSARRSSPGTSPTAAPACSWRPGPRRRCPSRAAHGRPRRPRTG